MATPPRFTVSAPPMLQRTAMKVAADKTAVVTPATNSTGASAPETEGAAPKSPQQEAQPQAICVFLIPAGNLRIIGFRLFLGLLISRSCGTHCLHQSRWTSYTALTRSEVSCSIISSVESPVDAARFLAFTA